MMRSDIDARKKWQFEKPKTRIWFDQERRCWNSDVIPTPSSNKDFNGQMFINMVMSGQFVLGLNRKLICD